MEERVDSGTVRSNQYSFAILDKPDQAVLTADPMDRRGYRIDAANVIGALVDDADNCNTAVHVLSQLIGYVDGLLGWTVPRRKLPEVVSSLQGLGYISKEKYDRFWQGFLPAEREAINDEDEEFLLYNTVNDPVMNDPVIPPRGRRRKPANRSSPPMTRSKRKKRDRDQVVVEEEEEEEDEIESWGDVDLNSENDNNNPPPPSPPARRKRLRRRRKNPITIVIDSDNDSEFGEDREALDRLLEEDERDEELNDAMIVAAEGIDRETTRLDQRVSLVETNTGALNALVAVCGYLRAHHDRNPMFSSQLQRSEASMMAIARVLDAQVPLESAGLEEHVVIRPADNTEVRLGQRARANGWNWGAVPAETKKRIAERASELHEEVYGIRPPKIRGMTNEGPRDINYYSLDTAPRTMDVALAENVGGRVDAN